MATETGEITDWESDGADDSAPVEDSPQGDEPASSRLGSAPPGTPSDGGDETRTTSAADELSDDERADAERDARGRFSARKHRASKDGASARDVPRIQELTRRLREAEAERDTLRSTKPAERAEPRQPPVEARRAPEPVTRPEPQYPAKPTLAAFVDQEDDYSVAVEKYTDALTDWKFTVAQMQHQAREDEQHAATEATRLRTSWKAKNDDARKVYKDFDAVALDQNTRIEVGSLIDAWILESDDGAHVLYHLQKHPGELDRLSALAPFHQARELALLGQRLSSPQRAQTVGTGSVATPVVPQAPRPPNPVRTGPVRASDEPPDDDSSLEEHERYFGRRAGRFRR